MVKHQLTPEQTRLIADNQKYIYCYVNNVYKNEQKCIKEDLYSQGKLEIVSRINSYDSSKGSFNIFMYNILKYTLYNYMNKTEWGLKHISPETPKNNTYTYVKRISMDSNDFNLYSEKPEDNIDNYFQYKDLYNNLISNFNVIEREVIDNCMLYNNCGIREIGEKIKTNLLQLVTDIDIYEELNPKDDNYTVLISRYNKRNENIKIYCLNQYIQNKDYMLKIKKYLKYTEKYINLKTQLKIKKWCKNVNN